MTTTGRRLTGTPLLLFGVIVAALVGVAAAAVQLRRTLDDCRRAEAAAAIRLDWYFGERPDPADFVLPEKAMACAPTRVTATSPVRTVERRFGGPVAVDVELRIEEDVPELALARTTVLRVGVHAKARPGLSSALRDTANESHVDTIGLWQLPVGTSVHVVLCRMEPGYVVTYAPKR